MIKTLEEFSRRVDELKAPHRRPSHEQGPPAAARAVADRVPQHPPRHAGIAHQPAEPRQLAQRRLRPLPGGQARSFRRQPAAGGFDRQEVPQPRPELPRPDPGGQRRPDAGGRQVRVSPRLQVLHLRHVVDPPGDHPRRGRSEPHDPHPGAHGGNDVQGAERVAQAAAGTAAASRRSRRSPTPRRRASTRPAACWP